MGWLDSLLTAAMTDSDFAGLNDDQVQAVVESLVYAMHANSEASDDERKLLTEKLSELPWAWEGDNKARIPKMVSDAEAMLSGLGLFGSLGIGMGISDIASRLPEGVVREKVFRMALGFVCADGTLDQEEKNVIGALGEAFGLDVGKARAIAAEVKAEYGIAG